MRDVVKMPSARLTSGRDASRRSLLLCLAAISLAFLLGASQASAAMSFAGKWGSLGTGDGQFDSPNGIAIDASGVVYVVDRGNNRVQKFTSTGAFQGKWGSPGTGDGQFDLPSGITADGFGNVFVGEALSGFDPMSGSSIAGNNRIQKFTSAGAFQGKWGSIGTGNGQFNSPGNLTTDASGNVYVVDEGYNRIQKFTSAGAFLGKWGSFGAGDGQFDGPAGIAIDASGNVYVVDSFNSRIQKFTSAGAFLGKWGSFGKGDGEFEFPWGVATDASGNVYVADSGNDRIQKFTSGGSFLEKWGSFGTGDGEFDNPLGVAVDASQNVYVTDGNDRVQVFAAAAGPGPPPVPAIPSTTTPALGQPPGTSVPANEAAYKQCAGKANGAYRKAVRKARPLLDKDAKRRAKKQAMTKRNRALQRCKTKFPSG